MCKHKETASRPGSTETAGTLSMGETDEGVGFEASSQTHYIKISRAQDYAF